MDDLLGIRRERARKKEKCECVRVCVHVPMNFVFISSSRVIIVYKCKVYPDDIKCKY